LERKNQLEFQDSEVKNLDLNEKAEVFHRLVVKCFCSRKSKRRLTNKERKVILASLNHIKNSKISYQQLNELLLLMNQDRIGSDFFKFCFKQDMINLDDLKNGITKFRGFAILCYGNLRFAFRELAQMEEVDLKKALSPFCEDPSDREKSFSSRPPIMLNINNVNRSMISFIGELSGRKINKEIEFLEKELRSAEKKQDSAKFLRLLNVKKKLDQTKARIVKVQEQALENTDVYLTWDYVDVYIATSMRHKWEYEETYDFIHEVFKDANLQNLNIRYFDPTQSKCSNSRDKGLVEGLMLRRSLCAIYMAQEGDTMGKDCELAASLAQSKPVIVYVPRYDPKQYSKKIAGYPLDFFRRRLQILDAEETLSEAACEKALRKCDKRFEDLIDKFLEELDDYRSKEPYSVSEVENKFKRQFKDFSKICEIVSIAECYNFEQRAKLLKGLHPLCMQVDLRSGVANGVLVVRNPKDCATLLQRLLTNRMKFTIKHEEGFTVLKEDISECVFRAVTDYEKLTNSFWNLFSKA
jgi:hypothetical protein